MIFLNAIFPSEINNVLLGSQIPLYFFMVITFVSLIRSCIHLFYFDGGAGSIAGINLSYGQDEIIFAFALWGSSQLLFALMQLFDIALLSP